MATSYRSPFEHDLGPIQFLDIEMPTTTINNSLNYATYMQKLSIFNREDYCTKHEVRHNCFKCFFEQKYDKKTIEQFKNEEIYELELLFHQICQFAKINHAKQIDKMLEQKFTSGVNQGIEISIKVLDFQPNESRLPFEFIEILRKEIKK